MMSFVASVLCLALAVVALAGVHHDLAIGLLVAASAHGIARVLDVVRTQ